MTAGLLCPGIFAAERGFELNRLAAAPIAVAVCNASSCICSCGGGGLALRGSDCLTFAPSCVGSSDRATPRMPFALGVALAAAANNVTHVCCMLLRLVAMQFLQQQPLRWCSGCLDAFSISFIAQHPVLVDVILDASDRWHMWLLSLVGNYVAVRLPHWDRGCIIGSGPITPWTQYCVCSLSFALLHPLHTS